MQNKKMEEKKKKVFSALRSKRKLKGGHSGSCTSQTLCLSVYLLCRTTAAVIRVGEQEEGGGERQLEKVENVLTLDSGAKGDFLRVSVLLLCLRHNSSLRILRKTTVGVSCFAKPK